MVFMSRQPSVAHMSIAPSQSFGFLSSWALVQFTHKSRTRNGSSGYLNRFDSVPDAAILGPPECCLDMRKSVTALRWSHLLSGTFKSIRRLFKSSGK